MIIMILPVSILEDILKRPPLRNVDDFRMIDKSLLQCGQDEFHLISLLDMVYGHFKCLY